ncbi:transglutaminase [Tistrella bauzanensis]|uniref:Transglutaminase n=1 Tax=Tistrella bauzanensis TaxID=657419 RepID=A0ABQ1I9Y8_9PROT|nr:transglutaminase family protein [Tistrella bauzanensis]GGB27115.1 transglutaminase [Tistrella bauzanensis]
MRLTVEHQTIYTYGRPARYAIQALRLTPPDIDAQRVVSWRIDVEPAAHMVVMVDGFGNRVHQLSLDREHNRLAVTVRGVVNTRDTAGIVGSDLPDRLLPAVFLRETPLTTCSGAVQAFADDIAPILDADGPVAAMHAVMKETARRVAYVKGATDARTTAAQALDHGRGVCQDHAHVFIAVVRALGLPARYVSGYLSPYEDDNAAGPGGEASHAWAEAWLTGLGWVGFDPSNGISPTGSYIRLAHGLDYLDAAPVRGIRVSGDQEQLAVRVHVTEQAQQ